MKKNQVTSIFVALLMLLTFIQPVLAQDYYFEVPEEQVDVFIETDGTITIEYYYKFQNAGSAHVIDFVDIGMPGNSTYQLSDITANVDGKTITDITLFGLRGWHRAGFGRQCHSCRRQRCGVYACGKRRQPVLLCQRK